MAGLFDDWNDYGYGMNNSDLDVFGNIGNESTGLMDYFGSDSFSNFGKGLGAIGSLGTGLYGMYQGNKMLDLYGEQMDMANEQWGLQKEELARLQTSRDLVSADWYAGHPEQQARHQAALGNTQSTQNATTPNAQPHYLQRQNG